MFWPTFDNKHSLNRGANHFHKLAYVTSAILKSHDFCLFCDFSDVLVIFCVISQ